MNTQGKKSGRAGSLGPKVGTGVDKKRIDPRSEKKGPIKIDRIKINRSSLPPSFAAEINKISDALIEYESSVVDSKQKEQALREALVRNHKFLQSLYLPDIKSNAQKAFRSEPQYHKFFNDDTNFQSFLEMEEDLLTQAGATENTITYIKYMLIEAREEAAKGGESAENVIKNIMILIEETNGVKNRTLAEHKDAYAREQNRKLGQKLLAVGVIVVDTAGIAAALPTFPFGWIFACSIASGGALLK